MGGCHTIGKIRPFQDFSGSTFFTVDNFVRIRLGQEKHDEVGRQFFFFFGRFVIYDSSLLCFVVLPL